MRGEPWSLALVQAAPISGDAAANLASLERTLAEIARRSTADAPVLLAVFPELFLGGYDLARVAGTALSAVDPVLAACAQAARAHSIAVVLGFAERAPDGRLMNSAAVIDAHGEFRALHRKMHLFGRERDVFTAGTKATMVDLDDFRLGIGICFDLEFPEYARLLALQGTEILCFPTASMLPWTSFQETYGAARAMENQLFVAVANRVGCEGGLTFFGESGVFGPDGSRLVPNPGRDEWCGIVRIDPALLQQVASYPFHYLDERRPALYRALVETAAGLHEPLVEPTADSSANDP